MYVFVLGTAEKQLYWCSLPFFNININQAKHLMFIYINLVRNQYQWIVASMDVRVHTSPFMNQTVVGVYTWTGTFSKRDVWLQNVIVVYVFHTLVLKDILIILRLTTRALQLGHAHNWLWYSFVLLSCSGTMMIYMYFYSNACYFIVQR